MTGFPNVRYQINSHNEHMATYNYHRQEIFQTYNVVEVTTVIQAQQILCQIFSPYLVVDDHVNIRENEMIALGLARTNIVNREQVGERVPIPQRGRSLFTSHEQKDRI